VNATSQRNLMLLDAIAAAFVKAVLHFCTHDTLCYTWPLFLPSKHDSFDSFWSPLVAKIKELIISTPILKSRHMSRLRKTDEVFILASDFTVYNSQSNPLLDCIVRDPFISSKYLYESWDILRTYGLRVMYFSVGLDLLGTDLERADSIMKSSKTTERWHSTMADFLLKCHESRFMSETSRLRSLPILPKTDSSSDNFIRAAM
jgi:hypothetical protein